jgi:8-oxo-dGTP pyrophosphatase MutT (NUDIX family)
MEENIRIYYKEQCIFLTSDAMKMVAQEKLTNAWIVRNQEAENVKELFQSFFQSSFETLLWEGEPSECLKNVERCFRKIEAGGGLVWNENKELLMIERLGKWDLPKGKIDPGEKFAECALREVAEETGVTELTLEKKLINTYHIYEFDDKWILKLTAWYEMKAPKQALVPEKEEGITQTVWASNIEVAEYRRNTYRNVDYILGKCLK